MMFFKISMILDYKYLYVYKFHFLKLLLVYYEFYYLIMLFCNSSMILDCEFLNEISKQ